MNRLTQQFMAKRSMSAIMPSAQRSFSGIFANHRDTEDNLEESPFEFT
jgi:hypothetical protein